MPLIKPYGFVLLKGVFNDRIGEDNSGGIIITSTNFKLLVNFKQKAKTVGIT